MNPPDITNSSNTALGSVSWTRYAMLSREFDPIHFYTDKSNKDSGTVEWSDFPLESSTGSTRKELRS
jgi:hypothetical protein